MIYHRAYDPCARRKSTTSELVESNLDLHPTNTKNPILRATESPYINVYGTPPNLPFVINTYSYTLPSDLHMQICIHIYIYGNPPPRTNL